MQNFEASWQMYFLFPLKEKGKAISSEEGVSSHSTSISKKKSRGHQLEIEATLKHI